MTLALTLTLTMAVVHGVHVTVATGTNGISSLLMWMLMLAVTFTSSWNSRNSWVIVPANSNSRIVRFVWFHVYDVRMILVLVRITVGIPPLSDRVCFMICGLPAGKSFLYVFCM